jgi:hypothetical protein
MRTCVSRRKTFTHWSQLTRDASSLEDGHSSGVGKEASSTSRQ